MSYTIYISKGAEKDLAKIPANTTKKIVSTIDGLENNPRPRGSKKLKGSEENFWRVRVGDYRIVYLIEDTIKVIDIRKIGHRKDVYE